MLRRSLPVRPSVYPPHERALTRARNMLADAKTIERDFWVLIPAEDEAARNMAQVISLLRQSLDELVTALAPVNDHGFAKHPPADGAA